LLPQKLYHPVLSGSTRFFIFLMVDQGLIRRGFAGFKAADHVSAPRGGGFAFDEDSHPYYIDYEARAPLPFPDDGKGGFLFGEFPALALASGISRFMPDIGPMGG
jgi:hypothetical protein